MADRVAAYEIEARLLRWSDSSTAGRTITLELDPEVGEVHPFKAYSHGKHGTRFRLLFVPIGDDELPVVETPPAPDEARGSVPTRPKNGDASDRAKRAFHDDNEMGQAARLAGIWRTKDAEYQRWLAHINDCRAYDAAIIAQLQRQTLGVQSCSEIATDPAAFERWKMHKLAFEQAVGRAARPS